ncbi:MAG: SAM-dependent methyltransferase [Clostridia bacterium]|nr:SAM-dependent methyltransferase [Clostridia bacterium]
MQSVNTLGARLASAKPFVTQGGRVIDVGTDHAYLPIALIREEISSAALACDINEGPIASARENIAAAGLSDRIETRLTDGLHGTEDFSADDVLIFGMGGELIVRILSEAPFVKDNRVGLVLQPMSRASVLRRYLAENGFEIVGEALTFEDKYYQTIAARYSGKCYKLSDVEAWVGAKNIETRPLLFEGFVRHEIGVFDAILKGKAQSINADVTFETEMKRKLEELL